MGKTLLKIIGGAIALGGIGGLFYYLDPAKENNLNYQKNEMRVKGMAEHDEARIIETNSGIQTELDDESLLKSMQPTVEKIVNQVKDKYGEPKEIKLKKIESKHFYELCTDTARAINYIENSKQAIAHAGSFFNHPGLKMPELEFNIPKDASVLEQSSQDKKLIFHIIERSGEKVKMLLTLKYNGRNLNAPIETTSYAGGSTKRTYSFLPKGDNFGVKCTYRPFVLTLTDDKPALIISAPHEVLHEMLGQYTLKHMSNERQKNNTKIISEIQQICARCGMREEMFATVLSNEWFKVYNKELNLGFNEEELKIVASIRTPRVLSLQEKVKSIGIKKAIDDYISNQDELFGE